MIEKKNKLNVHISNIASILNFEDYVGPVIIQEKSYSVRFPFVINFGNRF